MPNQNDAPLAAVRAAAGRSRTFPRALVLAVAIVIAFEIVLRNSRWPQHWPYELGRMEYFVDAAQIERAGSADIAIVGSSRTRESIIVPLMAQRVSKALGRPTSVASYAASGAVATDFEAITDRLLRASPKPKLVMIGVSERDLIYAGRIWDEVATFHNFDDMKEAFHERRSDAFGELPVVVRSKMGRWWRTLGLREMIRFKVVALLTGTDAPEPTSPAEGGLTIWQRDSPTRSLKKNPIKVKSRVLERSAAFKAENFPDPQLANALDDLMSACGQAGVPLVLYEVHTSRALRNAMPKGFYKHFADYITELAARHSVLYVRLDKLKLKLGDEDMREPSHMSFIGATKLTNALADRVVVPELSGAKKRKKPATTRASDVPTTQALSSS